MKTAECWTIENYSYRRSPRPWQEFQFAVSLHNHSRYSIETMGFLNEVMALGYMRPLRGTVRSAFGFAATPDLDYSQIYYRSPLTVEEVFQSETESATQLGFDGVHLGITDHDEIDGSLELLRHHPELTHRIPLGEEISFHFDGYLFHLGITGYSAREIAPLHAALQQAASANRLDDLFEMLHATECLVVFNHPLVPWGEERGRRIPAEDLLRRYGFAIHALEFNGMRSREENERVLELAKHTGKPVIGGGDSHLLMASSVLTLTQAPDYNQFAAEVKEGRAVPLITPAFFAPLGWKLFLRVLFFMGHYRRIGHFRGQPVSDLLRGRTVGLDPIGYASRLFLQLAGALGVVR